MRSPWIQYPLIVLAFSSLALLVIFSLLPREPEYQPPDPADVAKQEEAGKLVNELVDMVDARAVNVETGRRPVPPDEGVFTVSEELRPRVDFWKRVYTSLYSFQAIIHDSKEVDLVYAIVDLRDAAGADPNDFDSVRKGARSVLKTYQGHLQYILKGKYKPAELTGERRRLYSLLIARGGLKKHKGYEDRVRIQRGLREQFRDGIIRSGRYIDEYRRIFRENGLPEELTLLPHLESSFRYDANSYAGAVGIWQLTRGASTNLIHVSYNVDERVDPWSSAEAAARILKYNYNKLKSWPLAITAYNQGLTSMRRAVSRLKSDNIEVVIDQYTGSNFGFAGRNFYCAFVAILEVLRDYETYFGNLEVDDPLEVNRHKLSKSATLKTVAAELGVEAHVLARMNPHLRKQALSSRVNLPRGVHLNLPTTEILED